MKGILICLLIGYVLGSFLTAVFVVKRATGKDVSEIGSGNPGMANVMSNVGKKEGVLVLLGDIGKTALAMALAWLACRGSLGHEALLWSGFGAILGHNYPFWRKFKGGKGVAVSAAWLVVLLWPWGALTSIAGGLITILTGWLPLGAVLIPLFALPAAFLKGKVYGLVVLASLLLMLVKHWPGLVKIRKGEEERKFRKGKKA